MVNLDPFEALPNYATFLPDNGDYDLFGDYAFDLDLVDFQLPDDNFEIDAFNFPFQGPGTVSPDASDPLENSYELLNTRSVDTASPSIIRHVASMYSQTGRASQSSLLSLAGRQELPSNPVSVVTDRTIKSSKHKWQDNVTVFSAKGKQAVTRRRRRSYSPSRKEMVALNRLIGACIQCKLRKGPCDSGISCSHCAKRAGSATLGREICVRQNLTATRFNHVDLFRGKFHEETLDIQGLRSQTGPRRSAFIGFMPEYESDIAEAFIEVPIISSKTTGESNKCYIVLFNYYQSEIIPDRYHQSVLVWDSIPTVDRLLRAYRFSSQSKKITFASPFWGLQKAVRAFAEEYCTVPNEVPLRELLHKILRMQELVTIYRGNIRFKETLDSTETAITSHESSTQLKYIISKEILQLEIAILAEIDRRVHTPKSISKEEPLAFWVCLWTLIFCYKSHVVYCRTGINNPRIIANMREEMEVYELSRHIYNILTSIYATIYRTTSPLAFDWRRNEVAEMLGHNQQLIGLFCNIKTEMFWFQAEKEFLFADDAIFKKLVLENENKLLEAHRNLAKKQGIL